MITSLQIEATPEEIFECIENSLIEDVRHHQRKEKNIVLHKGFSYSKTLMSKDKKYRANVLIDVYEKNHKIESVIDAKNLKYRVGYELIEKKKYTEVQYSERVFNGDREVAGMLNSMSFFMRRRKMKAILEQLKEAVESKKVS